MQEFKRHLSFIDFDIPGLAREFHISPDKQKNVMISTAKRILDITEDDIAAMTDELGLMYPVGYDLLRIPDQGINQTIPPELRARFFPVACVQCICS